MGVVREHKAQYITGTQKANASGLRTRTDKAHKHVRSSPLIRWLVFRACPRSLRPWGRGRGGGGELPGSYLINPRAAAIGRRWAADLRPRVNWADYGASD